MTEFLPPLALAAALAFLIMLLLWLVQRKTHNAGIVDIGWSGTIPALALLYAFLTGSFASPRTLIALAMVFLWGGRLVWHIHERAHGLAEDARYAELRQRWAKHFQWKMFLFFEFQAAAAVIFSIPFLIVMKNPQPSLSTMEIAGIISWIIAWLGEGAADRQLARFKAEPSTRGKVCEDGLWNYSRHPNYFFEWLIWVSLAVFCWSSPMGYLGIICPLLMMYFLFKVTGIPATEEQALKSKGDAYRRYQQTTSAFFPWFKKRV
jgi:steroid 5-alpha reductase family enzyme